MRIQWGPDALGSGRSGSFSFGSDLEHEAKGRVEATQEQGYERVTRVEAGVLPVDCADDQAIAEPVCRWRRWRDREGV